MTGAAPSLYEPINRYKPIGPDIGVVDGPFEYLTTAGIRLPLPFTTRMTVLRLRNGDLFMHSPIAFDAALADDLGSIGRMRHLISPNQFHYAQTKSIAWQSSLIRSTVPLPPTRARCFWSKATPMPWAPRLTTCRCQIGARIGRVSTRSAVRCTGRESDDPRLWRAVFESSNPRS